LRRDKMGPDFNKEELIPAIIQDYATRQVLMLAYVNEESYRYMLENKETCFYSRSRKTLWHKGETSGNIQKIKEIYLDCDQDAILILVEQNGVACHMGKFSCFFNEIECTSKADEIDNNIFDGVYNTIRERKTNPIEGSYTNYLLDKGIDKICKKVGEEAAETIIAAKNTEKDELIGEICDLAYHTLVLMYDRDVSIKDIKRLLTIRHKKECNKKQENIKGEY
jgi:phosphoribosyl-ATP pyrophosphohydrolase/phosphoribosyl-AMP cyclohydrolase